MKDQTVMKSVKIKSKLKPTKTKKAKPTHRTKPRATAKTFKTTERNRVCSRAYHAKIAQLKNVDGCTAEEAKELARAHAKAVLLENGFSVQTMVPPGTPAAVVLREPPSSGPSRHPAGDFHSLHYQRHPALPKCGINLRSSCHSMVAK